MHWQSGGRDSHEEDGDQPRVGGAVAAPQARRQQWRVSLGHAGEH